MRIKAGFSSLGVHVCKSDQVISGVIVHPRLPGEKYQYEIKGWLSAIIGEELSAVLMVVEVRSDHDSRQAERTEISLRTWQIALERAIKQYIEKTREVVSANDVAAPDCNYRKRLSEPGKRLPALLAFFEPDDCPRVRISAFRKGLLWDKPRGTYRHNLSNLILHCSPSIESYLSTHI